MIGYYGWRGAGKTLSVAREIQLRIKKNPDLLVFTNTPFFFPEWEKREQNMFLWKNIDEVGELCAVMFPLGYTEKEIVVVIDEANLVMPSRFFGKLPDYFLVFLAESRHLNIDIIFTTQHPRRVDVIMRELVETWVHCERGFLGITIKHSEYVLDTQGNPIELLHTDRVWRPSRWWNCYDTFYMCVDQSQIPESHFGRVHDWINSALSADTSAVPTVGGQGAGESEGAGAPSLPTPLIALVEDTAQKVSDVVRASNSAPFAELQHILISFVKSLKNIFFKLSNYAKR